MSDPPNAQARRANGVSHRPGPSGSCMSTTPALLVGPSSDVVVAHACCQLSISDSEYVAKAASETADPPFC